MKKILTLMLALILVTPEMFARAGSSYSRSSSSFSSSKSSSSYSRPSSSSYSRPSYTSSRPSYTPPSRPAYQAPTVNRTTNVYHSPAQSNMNSGSNNGGGMGIGGTMLGVAGGVVAGNLLTNALTSDHRNSGYAPQGGYQSNEQGYPVSGQAVSPEVAGQNSGQYVTDGNGGYAPATIAATAHEKESSGGFMTFMFWLLLILGSAMLAYVLINKYLTARKRKAEIAELLDSEKNLIKFETLFNTIQSSYEAGARTNLITVMTPEMYNSIMRTKSANEDQGLTNVLENLNVQSIVNVSSWKKDGKKYQQAKIRFSLIDYTVDETGKVVHGSKEKPETVVEYWTFQSSSKDDWILSSIGQHSGYVHQS